MTGVENLTTIADLARQQAEAQPDKIAFKFEGQSIAYGTFNDNTNQAANGLLSLGVTADERIGYLGKNTHEYYELLIAACKAGGVMCPVNWRLALPEIAYIFNDARPRIVFIGPEFVHVIDELASQAPTIEHFIVLETPHADYPVYHQWRAPFDTADPHTPRSGDDDAIQLYTSGTTGRPKGAVISNRALLVTHKRQASGHAPEWSHWSPQDVSLIAMPIFHIGGTSWGVTGLANGATGVVMREFDPAKVLDFIDEHRISKLFLVPAAMQFVVNQPRAREIDYSQLKYMLYGASPIPLELLKTCIDVFKCGFVQMYGMTETSGTIVVLDPEDHDPNGNEKMRSAGKPLEGIEIAILGDQGEHLPPRTVGEIATRSDMNMTRYWNLPDATAATFTGDGWLRTGDAGYLDEDGYVYIYDRVKDLIISGGENIYPAEVENAIYGHPSVEDVAVVGVPDDKWGEAVKACVVVKDSATLSEDDVIAYARERIAAYKCPKSVDFIEALPRNPSGKILRRQIRAGYWRGTERSVN
ncbi:MAG: fatty acid--CoA ligase [Pseudomonadota bacterium]